MKMNIEKRNNHLQEALDHLIAAGKHLDSAGFPEIPEKCPGCENPDTDPCDECSGEYGTCESCKSCEIQESCKNLPKSPSCDCVMISFDDFKHLMQDLIELGDMLDHQLHISRKQEQLYSKVIYAATELNSALNKKEKLDQMQKRVDEIMHKWGNSSLFPVTD